MSISNQTRPYYSTVIILSILAAGILFYLLHEEKSYYSILVGTYPSVEQANNDLPIVRGLLNLDGVTYFHPLPYKGHFYIQAGKFEHRANAEKLKKAIHGTKTFENARVAIAHVLNGDILEFYIDEDRTEASSKRTETTLPGEAGEGTVSERGEMPAYDLQEYSGEARSISYEIFPEDFVPQVKGQSFYAIQLASSSNELSASQEYDRIVERFPPESINWLRVEHVLQYHVVRSGKFQTRREAEPAYKILSEVYPDAQVLKVHIKPERIRRVFVPSVESVPSQVSESLAASYSVKPPQRKGLAIVQESQVVVPETEREYFTVQLMSYSQSAPALREFDRLAEKIPSEHLSNLRVEHIRNYYTLRVGQFDSRSQAELLRKFFVDKGYKDAFVLSAYILPSRIAKIFSPAVSVYLNKEKHVLELDQPDPADIDTEPEDEEKTTEIEMPEKMLGTAPPVVPEPLEPAQPKEVTFSSEVLLVLDKDDKGENLRMPSSLFFDDSTGELYVLNSANNRFVVFGSDYFPQNSLGKGQGLVSPLAGAVDEKGNVFITQIGTPAAPTRLSILNAAFLLEREVFLEGIPDSADFIFQKIAVAKNGLIYVTGIKSRKVLVLDSAGNFKKWLHVPVDKRGGYALGVEGSESENKAEIKDVAIDSLGNIFLLSEESSKVYVFTPDEQFLFSFGTKGGGAGRLSRPRGLAIDEKKRCFYLVDYMRHTVLVYDFTGAFRFEFGGRGWGTEWFNYPVDVELGPQGQVIVADFFNQRVQVFETTFSAPLPQKPKDLWTVADTE